MTNYFRRIPQILPRMVGAKFFFILVAISSFIAIGCNKSSIVGLEVQPTGDLLHVVYLDTATLLTKTIREDSLRTEEGYFTNEGYIIAGQALLGKYIDPVFGVSSASIYTQLRLPSVVSSFGIHPICDSVVISLVYDTTYCYGKKDRKAQTVNVFELSSSIITQTPYFSTNSLGPHGFDLANAYSFVPRPLKSVLIPGLIDGVITAEVKSKPQLRIPINMTFGQNLLDNPENLTSNPAFQNILKGFYITTENTSGLTTNEGNIMNIKMSESKLTVYYHNSKEFDRFYDFSFSDVNRFRNFKHYNYSSVDPSLAVQLGPTPPLQNNTVFVQSMSGVSTKIEMPYLMNWLDSGAIAINKAELIIKVDPSPLYQLDTFAAPAALFLWGIDDNGSTFLLPDYWEGANYYQGTYNSTTKEYHFNIARYVQQVLNGKRKNNGLNLQVAKAAINANRAALGGGGSGPNQMKLNITYTKLH